MALPSTNESVKFRVANFSKAELQFNNILNIGDNDLQFIVNKIREYADLPYVFIFSNDRKEWQADGLPRGWKTLPTETRVGTADHAARRSARRCT